MPERVADVRPLRPELAHALEAEQAVLGALFIDKAAFAAVKDLLSTTDFYLAAHQHIWAACCELVEDGVQLEPQAAADRLEAQGHLGREVPPELPYTLARALGTAGNIAHYAKVVAETARVRRVQLLAHTLLDRSRHAASDPAGFLEAARAHVAEVLQVQDAARAKRIPVIHARDVQEKPVDWIVEHFLARGELTDLFGDPGVGKGHITASWAARITRTWPKASVIFFATEDPLGRVRARLRSEGADLSRCLFLDITKPDASPTLPGDIGAVEALVREHDAMLLVLDPAIEFMDSALDSHKQQDVARFMAPLLGVAMRTGAGLLTVRHNNKNSGASAMYRAAGSIGFVAKARIALYASKNEETGQRALATTKNNLATDKHTVAYDIVTKDGASVVAWGEVLAVSADELANQEPKKRTGRPPKLEATMDVLRSMLANGPMKVDDVVRCAAAEKISRTTVYAAAKAMKLERVTVQVRPAWRLPSIPENEANRA